MNEFLVAAGRELSSFFDFRCVGLVLVSSGIACLIRHRSLIGSHELWGKIAISAGAGASFTVALRSLGLLLQATNPGICSQLSTSELSGLLGFPVLIGLVAGVVGLRSAFGYGFPERAPSPEKMPSPHHASDPPVIPLV